MAHCFSQVGQILISGYLFPLSFPVSTSCRTSCEMHSVHFVQR